MDHVLQEGLVMTGGIYIHSFSPCNYSLLNIGILYLAYTWKVKSNRHHWVSLWSQSPPRTQFDGKFYSVQLFFSSLAQSLFPKLVEQCFLGMVVCVCVCTGLTWQSFLSTHIKIPRFFPPLYCALSQWLKEQGSEMINVPVFTFQYCAKPALSTGTVTVG